MADNNLDKHTGEKRGALILLHDVKLTKPMGNLNMPESRQRNSGSSLKGVHGNLRAAIEICLHCMVRDVSPAQTVCSGQEPDAQELAQDKYPAGC
jgi:hypothetical protein